MPPPSARPAEPRPVHFQPEQEISAILRLTVDAHLLSEETRQFLEQAFADRRLGRMVLRRLDGSLPEARARYAEESSPPLLLVETHEEREVLLRQIDALAETCDAASNLILLGRSNDVETYRVLTRRGVADYLVLPTQPLRLVEAILDLYADPAKAPKGQIYAFIGAKGGAGSSVLAHNTAFALSRFEKSADETIIADLDLPFGSADLSFNIETATGIRNVMADPDRIDEVFLQRFAVKYGERLHLLAAPAILETDVLVESRSLEMALEAMKQQVRHIVLDLPRLWTEWVRNTLRQADQVVVVTTADLAGMRNARNLIDFIAASRPLDTPPLLVLNRQGTQRKGEIVTKDFAIAVGMEPSVVIPEDGELFGQAASLGKMLAEIKPRAKAVDGIQRLAERLGCPNPGKNGSKAAGKGTASSLSGWLARLRGRG